jgi:fluoride exporter
VITALLVLLGGGVGAVARFGVDALVQARRLGEFPLGTFVVNLGGSFALGVLVGLSLSHRAVLIIGTATLGSYTTFSTWMLETHRPAEDGEVRLAWLNIGAGLLVGFAATSAGKALGVAL